MHHSIAQNLSVGEDNFEVIYKFKYLGVNINKVESVEINESTIAANKCSLDLRKFQSIAL